MSNRNYLTEFQQSTSPKYFKRYIPPTLTDKEKRKVAKILILRRENKSKEITPSFNRRPRKSTFTIQFNKKYGGLKDKSIKNLAKYFKIQPIVLNTIYDKAAAAWFSSGSRIGIPQQAWSYARLYKAILNIMKARKTGELPTSEGHDKSLVKKAMEFNNFIPKDMPEDKKD